MQFADEFNGRKVIVTGACGIIGGWIADGFRDAGATVCLTDRDQGRLDLMLADWAGDGHLAIAADLRDMASMSALAERVATEWGAPDILINNAGIYPSGFLLDIDVDEWDAVFDVNLRAPFVLSKLFARQMIEVGKGDRSSTSRRAPRARCAPRSCPTAPRRPRSTG